MKLGVIFFNKIDICNKNISKTNKSSIFLFVKKKSSIFLILILTNEKPKYQTA